MNLTRDFPPVPTAEWEAAIAHDLHGADYDRKLVWRTEEGLAIRPYYRREALAGLEAQHPLLRPDGLGWEMAQDWKPDAQAIRADLLHEAGAHAVQELGYGIAAGVERLAELAETLPPDAAAREIEFVFAIGPAYFIEIAKLRAARLLWAQAAAAFGATDCNACRMRLHARTPRRNKSLYDPYTNLLRVTTEAMAAVLGGCDRLTVEPFGFDPHLALNLQRILREESHLDAVADAAGGSYYLEALTDALGRAAWKLLQNVEAEGGYARALATGEIGQAIAETRVARVREYSARRCTLVGVNNYPDLTEKAPAFSPPAAEPGPLPASRLAEPFENIRRRTERYAQAAGRYPQVLLLERGAGPVTQARANFCLNFFGCAGFDLKEAEDYRGTDPDLIVLCAPDCEYPALAREVCAHVTAPVLVAGDPQEHAGALRAAGVAGFVGSQSDWVETLTEWQDKLGIEP